MLTLSLCLQSLREGWEQQKATVIATAQSKPGADPSQLDALKREADNQIGQSELSPLVLALRHC